MPSKSEAQKKFMAAAAHNPKFAKKAGISTVVANEFNTADGKKNAMKNAKKDDKDEKKPKKGKKALPDFFKKGKGKAKKAPAKAAKPSFGAY